MRTLLLIPSRVKTGIDGEVRAGRHPRMDYHALAAALACGADADADAGEAMVEMLDHAAVERSRVPLVLLTERVAGKDAALALLGFLRCCHPGGGCDAVFTNGENVGIPLALLLRTLRWRGMPRPGHVTIGHRLSTGKKRLFFRTLGLHREMDTIFVYAATQAAWGRERLGIPPEKLRRIAFHADHRFYRPLSGTEEGEAQVCSAGLEWRDYPTLIAAARRMPGVAFRLAAASPWSKHANEVADRTLPSNVAARRYPYDELRDLYARSAAVAVPLYDNDFQAGVTTLLEAMSMGRAVVVTRTAGQTDVVVDGENGLTVPPGDPDAWERVLRRLLADPAERQRLGENARRWVERHATLDSWVAVVVTALRESSVPRRERRAAATAVRDRPAIRAGAGRGA